MIRVLFVDDDPVILRMIARMLEGERDRWDLVFALGGEAAIAALERSAFDVLVTDLCMPKVNGLAVLAAARNAAPQMTRILFTASVVDPSTIDALEILEKPCSLDRLRDLLERVANARVAESSAGRVVAPVP